MPPPVLIKNVCINFKVVNEFTSDCTYACTTKQLDCKAQLNTINLYKFTARLSVLSGLRKTS